MFRVAYSNELSKCLGCRHFMHDNNRTEKEGTIEQDQGDDESRD